MHGNVFLYSTVRVGDVIERKKCVGAVSAHV
jgi:hypothetical protein